jgi:hypothetical protein
VDLLLSVIGLIAPSAYAVSVTDAINIAGSGLVSTVGTGTFGSIVNTVAASFIPIINVAGSLAIIIAGFFLTITGNEAQATTAKRVFIAGIGGIVLVNVGTAFVSALITGSFTVSNTTLVPTGTTILTNPLGSGGIISAEAVGLLDFVAVPLGIVCVLMIIMSGVRAIANFGSEDGVAQLRRTVIFVVAGFMLVASRVFLAGTVTFTGLTAAATPGNIISTMVYYTSAVFVLLLTLAFGMLVYAGILMIANVGNEDGYSRAKSLILRVAIGFIVLLGSGGIIIFFVNAICNGTGPCV